MKVCLITATKNRHKQLERVVRCSLNQISNDWLHLIYNNSNEILTLDELLPSNRYLLINKPISTETGQPYSSLGEIYNDILDFIPEDCNVLSFMDDDDIFMPNHVSEGIKGLIEGGKTAYKPAKSWYKDKNKAVLADNNLEPSVFVYKDHITKYKFSKTTNAHLQWFDPLIWENKIYIKHNGVPTFIYDWSQEIPAFKASGNADNPDNFKNYAEWSKDSGDGVITPCPDAYIQTLYI